MVLQRPDTFKSRLKEPQAPGSLAARGDRTAAARPPSWLFELLACPVCTATFQIEEGALRCSQDHVFPVRNRIPRFVADELYAASFGFEWNQHQKTQLDCFTGRRESEEKLRSVLGFPIEDLRGKLVLEAGSGAGRFVEVLSRFGVTTIGTDLSTAVDASQRVLGRREGVAFVQADLFHLPFPPGSFDLVYSIGVLHHTPDPRGATLALARLVKPGGMLAVHLYDRPHPLMKLIFNTCRLLTTRMPHRLLHLLCYLAVPKYYLDRTLLFTRALPPTSLHPDWRTRVLDTFDWYSPRYMSFHTYGQLLTWMQEAGLSQIHIHEPPISATATRR